MIYIFIVLLSSNYNVCVKKEDGIRNEFHLYKTIKIFPNFHQYIIYETAIVKPKYYNYWFTVFCAFVA